MQDIIFNAEEAFNPLILKAFITSKRALVVTGAGISVSSGIPDFRSFDGYYNKAKDVKGSCKGKDLFDAQVLRTEESFSTFLKFIAQMKDLCDNANPSKTHLFLDFLCEKSRLLRCYTQNIDCLEDRLPFEDPKKKKKKFDAVVKLHGCLNQVICTLCSSQAPCDYDHLDSFRDGVAPDCARCKTISDGRVASGKRSKRVGKLRPDIVLYNESHPSGDEIATMFEKDLAKKPDLLLVMGTSLKVTGIKAIVKRAAKTVHQSEGALVILINKTPITAVSEWNGVFDYQIIGSADDVTATIQRAMDSHFSLGKKVSWTSPIYHSPSQSHIKDFFRVRKAESSPSSPARVGKKDKGSLLAGKRLDFAVVVSEKENTRTVNKKAINILE